MFREIKRDYETSMSMTLNVSKTTNETFGKITNKEI